MIHALREEHDESAETISSQLPTDLRERAQLFSADWYVQGVDADKVLFAIEVLAKILAKHRAVAGGMLAALDKMAEQKSSDETKRRVATAYADIIGVLRDGSDPAGVVPNDEWIRLSGEVALMKHEVTLEQYMRFDSDRSKHSGATGRIAASRVSWCEARAFAAWAGYRLPTREEWIQACGENASNHGWFPNEKGETSPVSAVGRLPPNNRGFYDMFGNAAEWIQDRGKDGGRFNMGGNVSKRPDSCASITEDRSVTTYTGTGIRLVRDLSGAKR